MHAGICSHRILSNFAPDMNSKLKGYTLGAVAAATYGMNPLFALPLYADGMDADSVLFFRYLFAIPILGIMIRSRGRSFRMERRPLLALVAMGIMMAFSSLFLFQSYNYMDAGIASSLLFVYPVMVAVMMTCVFHERLTMRTVLCMVLALAGIGLLYKGENGATLSLTGTVMVFLSALTYAVYIVFINRSRLNSLPTVKVTFYVLLFGWTVFAVRLMAAGSLNTPSQWYLWGNLLALAVFPTAISLLCTTVAIQHIGSTPTAILGALEPVTAVIIGITVFGEHLTPRSASGIMLIIAAVTLVVAGGSAGRHLMRLRKLFPRIDRKHRRPHEGDAG